MALRTLPLEPGTAASVAVFDITGGRAVPQRVEVGATEQVTVPAGTFDAARIDVRPADGSPGGSTVWIERAAPHRVLRVVSQLPAAAGGGTVTQELIGS
jgi:hypothetical protein